MEPIKTIVTERAEGIDNPTIATTDPGDPNIHVQPMPWWQIVGVRAARVYLQSLVSFLTVTPVAIAAGVLPQEFAMSVYQAALMAVAPAGLSFLQNALELLVRLDESLPKLRA